MELENQPFQLAECIEAALDLLAHRAAEKGLEMVYLVAPEVPSYLMGDVTRVRQILVNLLSNAVKFTDKGEILIEVKAQKLGQSTIALTESSMESALQASIYELVFAVHDTGIGIPPDRLDRVFQSFSQVDSSTTLKYGGTSLGLAITKSLSE